MERSLEVSELILSVRVKGLFLGTSMHIMLLKFSIILSGNSIILLNEANSTCIFLFHIANKQAFEISGYSNRTVQHLILFKSLSQRFLLFQHNNVLIPIYMHGICKNFG